MTKRQNTHNVKMQQWATTTKSAKRYLMLSADSVAQNIAMQSYYGSDGSGGSDGSSATGSVTFFVSALALPFASVVVNL